VCEIVESQIVKYELANPNSLNKQTRWIDELVKSQLAELQLGTQSLFLHLLDKTLKIKWEL